MNFQEDSLQDHYHFLTDNGHTHSYTDHYYNKASGDGYDGPYGYQTDDYIDAFVWPYSSPSLSAKTGISVNGATGAKIDTETRPKNMIVVFIMKVC